jgi:hypothetical protein
VSLNLAPDEVTLHPAGAADAHGWVLPASAVVWEGPANLQLQPGRSDLQMTGGGGRGPHRPAQGLAGILYLPPDAGAADGMWARCRGAAFVLSQVRLMPDPFDGEQTCLVMTATQADRWPEGGM